jgi:hypothetical protein
LISNIAYIVIALGTINDAHVGALFLKFLCNAFADAAGSTGDDDDLVLKSIHTASSKVTEMILARKGREVNEVSDTVKVEINRGQPLGCP